MKNPIHPARLMMAALLGLAPLAASLPLSPALADGTHPSSTGPVCKGEGPCNTLEANCKGKYVDATDGEGTVYGKCYPKSSAMIGTVIVMPTAKPPRRLNLRN
jgi:hypothetical protein